MMGMIADRLENLSKAKRSFGIVSAHFRASLVHLALWSCRSDDEWAYHEDDRDYCLIPSFRWLENDLGISPEELLESLDLLEYLGKIEFYGSGDRGAGAVIMVRKPDKDPFLKSKVLIEAMARIQRMAAEHFRRMNSDD